MNEINRESVVELIQKKQLERMAIVEDAEALSAEIGELQKAVQEKQKALNDLNARQTGMKTEVSGLKDLLKPAAAPKHAN